MFYKVIAAVGFAVIILLSITRCQQQSELQTCQADLIEAQTAMQLCRQSITELDQRVTAAQAESERIGRALMEKEQEDAKRKREKVEQALDSSAEWRDMCVPDVLRGSLQCL